MGERWGGSGEGEGGSELSKILIIAKFPVLGGLSRELLKKGV